MLQRATGVRPSWYHVARDDDDNDDASSRVNNEKRREREGEMSVGKRKGPTPSAMYLCPSYLRLGMKAEA